MRQKGTVFGSHLFITEGRKSWLRISLCSNYNHTHTPPFLSPLFCIHFTLFSNPLLQRYNSFSRLLLMCVRVHVCVCLHTIEKWPRCVMTPAEATAQRVGVAGSDRLANEIWLPFQPGGSLSQEPLQIPSLGKWGTARVCMWEDQSPTLPTLHPVENVALRYILSLTNGLLIGPWVWLQCY